MHLVGYCANDRSKRHHAHARRKPSLLFKLPNGRFEAYDPTVHGLFAEFGEPSDGRQSSTRPAASREPSVEVADDALEFVLDSYLEDFLLSNWKRIDWGRPLQLYTDGHQYSTPIGRLDFLCVDPSANALVAVELKRGRPTDQVVGQIARYLGWLRAELAQPGQAVEGIIVAQDIGPKLQYSASAVPGVAVMTYEIAFRLPEVKLASSVTDQSPWPPPELAE